jgi:hypothetical protein
LQEGQAAEAARLLESYLRRQGGTADEFMLLGIALHQAGQGLAGLQALEQAVELEPGNAAAHMNLGQVYRDFGRHPQALAQMERALELRPDYPAASRAAEELRRQLAPPPPQPMGAGAAGYPVAGAGMRLPGGADAMPAAVGVGGDGIDTRPLGARLREAIVQLVTRPGHAVNGGLDSFFNTPGAAGAVVTLFMVSVVLEMLLRLLTPEGREGGALSLAVILGPVLRVIVCAAVIAGFNQVTGNSDEFAGDFGSLALGFGLIGGATRLVLMTVAFLVALVAMVGSPGSVMGVLLAIAVIAALWEFALQVWLVSAATDSNLFLTFVVLGAANTGAAVVTGMLVGGS